MYRNHGDKVFVFVKGKGKVIGCVRRNANPQVWVPPILMETKWAFLVCSIGVGDIGECQLINWMIKRDLQRNKSKIKKGTWFNEDVNAYVAGYFVDSLV